LGESIQCLLLRAEEEELLASGRMNGSRIAENESCSVDHAQRLLEFMPHQDISM
jgi:hypothetical protein